MFDSQKAGSVFHLKDQVQYEKDKAVKQVYIDQNGVRMLLVAIDHSCSPIILPRQMPWSWSWKDLEKSHTTTQSQR